MMGAGLAVVAVVGAVLSYVIVQPSTLAGSLATLSLSGSVITLAVALLAGLRPERAADLQEDVSESAHRAAGAEPLAAVPAPPKHALPT
jgi:hypothetical protein